MLMRIYLEKVIYDFFIYVMNENILILYFDFYYLCCFFFIYVNMSVFRVICEINENYFFYWMLF